jgi:hypothetical protein
MSEHTNQKPVGGTVSRVRDCYIWAAIHHLDSSSDYREFLPGTRKSVSPDCDLVLLDDASRVAQPTVNAHLVGALAALLVLVMLVVVLILGR